MRKRLVGNASLNSTGKISKQENSLQKPVKIRAIQSGGDIATPLKNYLDSGDVSVSWVKLVRFVEAFEKVSCLGVVVELFGWCVRSCF